MTVPLVAVVAMASNRVIGRDGGMPWTLKDDLRRYRTLTMNKPMIIGRKTLESIGRVLDGRDTVVLTRATAAPIAGAHLAADPDEAVTLARRLAGARGAEAIVVAGGGEIYRLFLDRLDRLYVTHVEAEPDGDAVFPTIDPAVWRTASEKRFARDDRNDAATRFVVYERR